MARNKNVGRTSQNNTGLVLQSKSELDTNEFGLIQCSLRFNLKSGLFPSLRPYQGTPCPAFTAGSDRTQSILDSLYYMGAQTSKHVLNGHCAGVDTLEVVCQGAIFDNGVVSGYAVSRIPVATTGSGYQSAPDIDIDDTYEVLPATATARLSAVSITIAAGGTQYSVGQILRLTGGGYDNIMRIRVTAVDDVATGVITAAVITKHGRYLTIPSNPAPFAGGTGTGATFNIDWNVVAVVVNYGGEYTARPTVALSGGSPTVAATLRDAQMLPTASGTNTDPFKPTTTVKDTTELTTYGTGGTLGALQARLAATSDDPIPFPEYGHLNPWFGDNVIFGIAPGPITLIDGRLVNLFDRVLLVDGTAYSGLYEVTQVGGYINGVDGSWFMKRVAEMDESAEFNTNAFIQVSDGDTNAGSLWQCTVSDPGFIMDTDTATFALGVAIIPTYVPTYKVTIEYRAIELHFLYVSATRRSEPLFLLDEYTLAEDNQIITDPSLGETTVLKIDSVTAVQQNVVIDPATGDITVTDGATVGIVESVWRPWVKYIGTAAQFAQTPAGQFWSVEETATVKMVGIPALGNIESS